MLENESNFRAGFGPPHNAAPNYLMLALLKSSGRFVTVPKGMAHCGADLEAARGVLLASR